MNSRRSEYYEGLGSCHGYCRASQEEHQALEAPKDAAPEKDPKEDPPLAAVAGGGGELIILKFWEP